MNYEFKGTPGPWRWEVNEKSKSICICGGRPFFDLTVMDFERWGMGGAAPSFREFKPDEFQVMKRADNFTEVEKGREHHSKWFKKLNHPDANLIAAAPDLLTAAIAYLEEYEFAHSGHHSPVQEAIKKAVHKALNIEQL